MIDAARAMPWRSQAPRDLLPTVVGFAILVGAAGFAYGFAAHTGGTMVLGIAVGLSLTLINRPSFAVAAALATLPFSSVITPGPQLPLGEVAATAAVVVAGIDALAWGARKHLRPLPHWASAGLILLAALILISLLVAGEFTMVELRRFGHLMLGFALVWTLARGVVTPRLAAIALLAGLYVSGGIGLIELARGGADAYNGRLTGLFGDPNVAGYSLVVLGAVALACLPSTRARLFATAPLLLLIGLTVSRTAYTAVGVMAVWLVLSRPSRLTLGLPAVASIVIIVILGTSLFDAGDPFASRSGSDELRSEIYHASEQRAWDAPVLGHGPAPQRVTARDSEWFFHNSYYASMSELGIPFTVLWLLVLIAAFAVLCRTTPRNPFLEAALLGVGVAALYLGEVLLELPTMVALGFALGYTRGASTTASTTSSSLRRLRRADLRRSVRQSTATDASAHESTSPI